MNNPKSEKSKRDQAIDLTKAICVIVMIVHHSIDYFGGLTPMHKWVRFVSGSFILLSGFLLSYYSLRSRRSPSETRLKGAGIIVKGAKLIALFIVINLIVVAIFGAKPDTAGMSRVGILMEILVFGNYRLVFFSLILIIGYLYVLIGILVVLFPRRFRFAGVLIAIIVVLSANTFFFVQDGGYNFRYLSIGLLGFCIGLLSPISLQRFSGAIMPMTALFVIANIAIGFLTLYMPVYSVIVIIDCGFFYALGTFWKEKPGMFSESVRLLSRYSLVAYLMQIAILYGLSTAFTAARGTWHGALTMLVVTVLLTTASVFGLDSLRRQVRIVDRMYRIILW